MDRYKSALLIVATIIIILIVVDLVLYFFPDLFLPSPNHQPFKSVWSEEDKRDMKELLTRSTNILEKKKIDMIAMNETLMGVARHKGSIPWNDTLEFVILQEQKEDLHDLQDEFKRHGIGMLNLNKSSKLYLMKRPRVDGVKWSWPFINILFYSKDKGEIRVHRNDNINSFSSEDFFPLRNNLFEDIPINMPNNVDSILENLYGKDWETVCKSSSYNHRLNESQKGGHIASLQEIENRPVDDGILDNIWVINLNRRPERWKTARDRLQHIGLHPRRWSATDKESRSLLAMYERISPEIRQGEFACYQSHLNLWNFLYESGVKYAIIFEDDIIIPPSVNMKDIINVINDSKGFDILLLGHCGYPIFSRKPTGTSRVGASTCTHAYAVSRMGLEKLVKDNHNYQSAVDHYFKDIFCDRNLCYYSKNKESLHQNSEKSTGLFLQDENFASDIQ